MPHICDKTIMYYGRGNDMINLLLQFLSPLFILGSTFCVEMANCGLKMKNDSLNDVIAFDHSPIPITDIERDGEYYHPDYPINMNTYFRNLDKYSPFNKGGSCGYVALSQYLSYYDTFLNDNIIPNDFDRFDQLDSLVFSNGTSYANGLTSSTFPSPGVLRESWSGAEDYGVYVYNTRNYHFHNALIQAYHAGFIPSVPFSEYQTGSTMMTLKLALQRFYSTTNLSMTAKLTNINELDLYSEFVSMSENYVGEIMENYLLEDKPVIISIIQVTPGEGILNYHACVAYDYEIVNGNVILIVNSGFGANLTHISIEDLGYNAIRGYLAIDDFGIFENHSHTNNYVIDGIERCGDGLHSNHVFSYTFRNSSTHYVDCVCGYHHIKAHSALCVICKHRFIKTLAPDGSPISNLVEIGTIIAPLYRADFYIVEDRYLVTIYTLSQ